MWLRCVACEIDELLLEGWRGWRCSTSHYHRGCWADRLAGSSPRLLLEVVNWSVWLTLLSNSSSLLSMSSLIASLYFFVGFYIEHQITENVITQQPYLRFRNARGAITAGVILETLSEGVGARLWLLYGPIGPVFLVLGSLIEHSIQYVVGRIPTRSTAINVQPIAKN